MRDFLAQFYAEMLTSEPDIDVRTKAAKDRAERIVDGKLEGEDDLVDRLKYLLSQYYKRPFSDPFWESLTVDELLLEVFLIHAKNTPPEQKTAEIIRENADELVDSLFGDLGGPTSSSSDIPLEEPTLTADEESFINNVGNSFIKDGFSALNQQQRGENEE
jgi:hypothetical protein